MALGRDTIPKKIIKGFYIKSLGQHIIFKYTRCLIEFMASITTLSVKPLRSNMWVCKHTLLVHLYGHRWLGWSREYFGLIYSHIKRIYKGAR